MVTVKPGALRELHWHPNASEWQYYMAGKGRMTVIAAGGSARTMDFNANDVGFVPTMAAHCVENTGDMDLVFLAMFKTHEYLDISLDNWLRHLPPEMVTSHTGLDMSSIQAIPAENSLVIAGA
jgi:oxalate decarboxylase